MKAYFADTSYFIALLAPRDQWHALATVIAQRADANIITTDYIILELASHFAKPPLRAHVVAFIETIFADMSIELMQGDASFLQLAWDMYKSHLDKGWSLIDCTSFVAMRQRKMTDALTSDHHFEQAGFHVLLKETSA